MSYYDQLAFASHPIFYLADPSTTDQSNGSVSIVANTLSATGQPIIYGHVHSFLMNSSNSLEISGNKVFADDVTTECVISAQKPVSEIAIFKSDNGSGLFLNPMGMTLRVVSINNGVSITNTCSLEITSWFEKLYVLITVSGNQIVLTINGKSSSSLVLGSLDTTATNVVIGTDFYTNYFFLLDGLGIYAGNVADKRVALNDPGSGHTTYAASKFGAQTTLFDTFSVTERAILSFAEFAFDKTDNSFVRTYFLTNPEGINLNLVIKTNDDNLSVDYDIGDGIVASFYKETTLQFSVPTVITFKVNGEVSDDFEIALTVLENFNIFARTPATLTTTGAPIFPLEYAEEIVNCPEGTNLDNVGYAGTWITSEFQNAIPKSIEIVFKPKDSTEDPIVFSSADGLVKASVQSGYSTWLNGILVTDFTNLRWGQWNHLVLTKTTPTATSFYLNTDGTSGEAKIDYLYLTSIDKELVGAEIVELNSIASGYDSINIDTDSLTISEDVFSSGEIFSIYSLSWSIVGAGGS